MITTNLIFQLVGVLALYSKKGWKVKLKEAIITLLFLRPAVDAYQVSTNFIDEEASFDTLR